MTEAEWLTGGDFAAHVRFAAARLSPRRQRLLAVALCRAASHLIDDPDVVAALEVVERYADGGAPAADLERARRLCRVAALEAFEEHARRVERGFCGPEWGMRHEMAWAVAFAATTPLPLVEVGNRVASAAVQERTGSSLFAPAAPAAFDAATAEQSLAMRAVAWEVVGNPFRPVAFNPAWRTDTVLALARHAYDRRDFSALPILADALQDAGCDSEDVLNHCRGAGPHARGCWVLDCVLGRE
jgi:hypothetical protein